jgi:LPXTG-site transpeptidase (sortase) family protein
MMHRLRNIDPRRALGAGVVLVSFGLLIAGVIGLYSALSSGGQDLPQEGSIDEITGESAEDRPVASIEPDPAAPAAPAPIRFVIPGLYIDAPVIIESVGEDKLPRVPGRPDQVAWYDFSSSPGQTNNAVFAGHVDWQTEDGVPIPGVFYRLREMKLGDAIEVALADGETLQYRVTGNVATPYNDPNVVKVMAPTDRDVITVITCGGTWMNNSSSSQGGNYSHRVIVRAERVNGLAEAHDGAAGG